MLTTLLAAAVLAQGAPVPQPRTIEIAVTDAKGAPVAGLGQDDLAVVEDGVARPVEGLEADRRPLTLAVLVDTSQAVGTAYRLNVVDAVTQFLNRLPVGSRFSLWTTGDRPTKILDFTDDPAAASQALKRLAPQGGNTLLDALVEASEDLKTQEGRRSAVVAVTGLDTEFSNIDRHQVVERAKKSKATFMAISYEEGPVGLEDRQRYDYVLGRLADETGGRHESLLSPMGVAQSLIRMAADLDGRYRLTYSGSGARQGKLEIKVARPGVKVRVASKTP